MKSQDKNLGSSVMCEFYVGEELHKGAARDLSTSEFFVVTDAQVDVPTELDVRLIGSRVPEPVYLKTLVIRRVGGDDVGVDQIRGLQLRVLELSPEYGMLLGAAPPRAVKRDTLLSERNRRAAADHEWMAGIAGDAGARPSAISRNAEIDRSRWESEPGVFERAGEAMWDEAPATPAALVIDDGELDDVVAMSQELGADTHRVNLGADSAYPSWSPPSRLLVITAERALSLRLPLVACQDEFTAIVITTSDARTIPMMMHRLGYRYVVRRPVHPEALRNLMRSVLHTDQGRRQANRSTMGCPIRWKRRLLPRAGILIDLSAKGCQLLVREAVTLGTVLKVRIPRVVAGQRDLVVKGKVVRRMSLRGDQRALGLRFDAATAALAGQIEQAISALADGPFRLSGELPPDDPAWQHESPHVEDPQELDSKERDRRRKPRVALRQPLVALDVKSDRVRHSLVGRDLAMEGLRIEPNPALCLEEQLRLAFYDSDSGDPLILYAVVARDDGPAGLWMRFVGLDDVARARLRTALTSLPSLESVEEEKPEPAWAMLGQVALEREPGPRA